MAAVKSAALRFLEQLPEKYRVGVVSFSSSAEVAAPATRDRRLVTQAVSQLFPGGGTALGDGIVQALNVGRAVPKEKGSQGRLARFRRSPSCSSPTGFRRAATSLREPLSAGRGRCTFRSLR